MRARLCSMIRVTWIVMLLATIACADRHVITLLRDHSGHACERASELPVALKMIKCFGRRIVVETAADVNVEEAVHASSLSSMVESVEVDHLVQVSTLWEQEALLRDHMWPFSRPFGIGAADMWKYSNGSSSISVAILDSGLVREHEWIFKHVSNGYDFITDDAVSQDGEAGRDPNWNDVGDSSTECPGNNWHGHRVASVVAAWTDEFRGVAPETEIIPVRVLGKCQMGYLSDVSDAIQWSSGGVINGVPSLSKPSDVISMSLSAVSSCPSYLQSSINAAIDRGSVLIASAGNDRKRAGNYVPCSCPGVYCVGASTRNGELALYSNINPSFAAPGGDYHAPVATIAPTQDRASMMVWPSIGTSFAAPFAAGFVALGLSLYGDNFRLGQSLIPFSNGCGEARCGAGILAFNAETGAIPNVNASGFVCSEKARHQLAVSSGSVFFPRVMNLPVYRDSVKYLDAVTGAWNTLVVSCSQFKPKVSAAEYTAPTGNWSYQFNTESFSQEQWGNMTAGNYEDAGIRLVGQNTLWSTTDYNFITYMTAIELNLSHSVVQMPPVDDAVGFITIDATVPLTLSYAGEANQQGFSFKMAFGSSGVILQASESVSGNGWTKYGILGPDGATLVHQDVTPDTVMEFSSDTETDSR